MAKPFDRDKLNMLSRDRAAVVAHQALDPIQSLQPHEQLAAIAVLFATFTTRFGFEPADAHYFGLKLLKGSRGQGYEQFHHKGNSQIEALEAFAGLSKQGALD